MNESEPSSKLPGLDPLTGVGDQSSFFRWLLESRKNDPDSPFTLVALDLNNFKEVNVNHGLDAGDEALRWVALVMMEVMRAPIYRIGGDEFVAVLRGEDHDSHTVVAERVLERLNTEGSRVHLKPPVSTIAVMRFRRGQVLSRGNAIGEIYSAIDEVDSDPAQSLKVFDISEMEPSQELRLRELVGDLATQLEQLAAELAKMHHMAHTDPLTGLPNVRAAMQELEVVLARSKTSAEPLSILLIDGDDLRRYNEISYSAGDEMLRNLGATQQGQLRAGDFLARWRMGDEFLVIMPATSIEEAMSVAERIRSAVVRESQAWPLPVTISAGLAAYPENGETAGELLYQAENAKHEAKRLGKNKVVPAT